MSMSPLAFYPQVHWLLLPYSKERVPLYYAFNNQPWSIPAIGPRPPYYANPRYVLNRPVI
ncbi:hypothetical protein SAMN02799630_04826 [Paenibacillus sp. UNCCL117]|uniref:hypothetical protein n=1 Tax=unclassified Paenibacillus TaxID=185978 RepID=UPI000882F6C7|nr:MULTISPECIES: hypothetical protein [unclassified Paenibacillus]SDE15145.1 hypothetical protein SAMN04488602_12043 [Paenibacillus sp. cl123]SFW60812.1 hypothetical protein SAMN02799630_04826 [Paenibacillus sp. UNCCL117]